MTHQFVQQTWEQVLEEATRLSLAWVGEIVLNQSRIQVYRNCPRKFYWKFVENLEPERIALNLEVGSGTHEGLAQLGAGADIDTAVGAARERFRKNLPKRMLPGDKELYLESEDLVEKLLRHYVEYWTDQGEMFRPLGNEVAGTVEVGTGTGIFQRFKTDKFVNAFHGLWIVDHKTAAKMDPREMMKYQMDLQMTSYIYGGRKLLGVEIGGVIVDFLVKTKVPQFAREAFERTHKELREFEFNFTGWAEKIRHDYIEMAHFVEIHDREMSTGPWNAFPRNESECFRYGTCPFRTLCLDPGNMGLRMEFVKREEDYVDNADLLKEK